MRTQYHLRERKILGGSDFKHHPNPTSALFHIIGRVLKYNYIKFKRNGS